MSLGLLSKLFSRVATRRLRPIDLANQHEFQGSASLLNLFGKVEGREKLRYPTRIVYLQGDDPEPAVENVETTWYNSRAGKPRAPEYRLYYSSDRVQAMSSVGDLLLLAFRQQDGVLLAIVAEAGSRWERKVLWLFGLASPEAQEELTFDATAATDPASELSAELILEALGMALPPPPATNVLADMLHKFAGRLPPTEIFSAYARARVGLSKEEVQDNPDRAVTDWLDQELRLFRLFEAHQVESELESMCFNEAGNVNVEGFLNFAKSLQQRRYSRAGYAFQDHSRAVLDTFGIRYTAQAITEAKRLPDFLFPGVEYYHDPSFQADLLFMLALKTTVRERFSQVATEAARIQVKHLFTIDPSISSDAISEMERLNLQLVIPAGIQGVYSADERRRMMSFSEFLSLMREKQKNLPNVPKLDPTLTRRMKSALRARKRSFMVD